MLQLHLSDRQFYCLLRCTLYQRFYSTLNKAAIALQWCYMTLMASDITGNWTVCSTFGPGLHQRKHQKSMLLVMRGISWWLLGYAHKGPVLQKLFPLHNVIMVHPWLWEMLNLLWVLTRSICALLSCCAIVADIINHILTKPYSGKLLCVMTSSLECYAGVCYFV